MNEEQFRRWRADPTTQEVLRELRRMANERKERALEGVFNRARTECPDGLRLAYDKGRYDGLTLLETIDPKDIENEDQSDGV